MSRRRTTAKLRRRYISDRGLLVHLELVGMLKVSQPVREPYSIGNTQMASFVGEGKLYFGAAALLVVETGEGMDALIEGVDYLPVTEFNCVRFQEGDEDGVYHNFQDLKPGDGVKVVLGLIFRITERRKVPAFRALSLEVLERATNGQRAFKVPLAASR